MITFEKKCHNASFIYYVTNSQRAILRNMVFYKMVLHKLDKFKIRCHNTISSADYRNTLENYTLL